MLSSVPITIIIPTIPEREQMLVRAIESVNFQSVEPANTFIVSHKTPDHMSPQEHVCWQINSVLDSVITPWVMRLADDDWFEPYHIEIIWNKIVDTLDGTVYYSYEKDGSIPQFDSSTMNAQELNNALSVSNWIDATGTAINTDFLRTINGFHYFGLEGGKPYEDWETWYAMSFYGSFRTYCVTEETWHAGRGAYKRIGP